MYEVRMMGEMEREQGLGQKALEFLNDVPAPRSALRMRYAAETKVFRDQHGGLENIREKLGFSRRKMCQLLLVDPSAWTRWMKDEAKVPPHIYRSLEWFLALNQKMLTQPDLAAMMNVRYRINGQALDSARETQLAEQIRIMQRDLKRQQLVSAFLTAGLLLMMFVCSWLVLR